MWPLSFSMVLQTLQLFNSLHFAMLCAMQSILEQSKRGLANPTVSQLFNSLYFTCLLLCRGLPSIPTEELQTLQLFNFQFFTFLYASFSTKLKCKNIYWPCGKFHFRGSCKPYSQSVVPFPVFYHAVCSAKHSRAWQRRPCKPYSSVVHFSVFAMLSAGQNIPEHSK